MTTHRQGCGDFAEECGDSALFAIDLKTRRVEIAGIIHQACDDWMKQMARDLTDTMDGFLRDARFLIHDRDPLFSASFCATLSATGVETCRLRLN